MSEPDGYASSDGVDVAYYRTGRGLPLLLINGGPGFPARHFRPLATQLAEKIGVEVIRFDQRGTGASTLDSLSCDVLTLDLLVADMEALRCHLGFESWIVMGHSFGAILAMALASKHPSTVEKLILSAPAGIDARFKQRLGDGIQASLSEEERQALAALSEAPDTYQRHLDTLSILLSAYVCDKSQLPALRAAVVDSRVYVPEVSTLVWAALEEGGVYDMRWMLQSVTVPAVILQGKLDPVGRETINEICELLPWATRVEIADASHYPWLDNPIPYFTAISEAVSR
jgi:proline iminopeptidase